MKVKELRKLFEKFPDEADVGFIGHFGEFVPADKYTFRQHSEQSFSVQQHGTYIIEICGHDFGESPD
jgi:hypothetical protein